MHNQIYYFENRRDGGRMVVGCTTTYAISANHHLSCEFEFHSRRGVLDTALCDKVFSNLQQVGCFLQVLRFPPTNKNDSHDLNEILLKVTLTNITLTSSDMFQSCQQIVCYHQ